MRLEGSLIVRQRAHVMPVDAGHQVSGRGVVVISPPERDAEPEETAAAETANVRDTRLG